MHRAAGAVEEVRLVYKPDPQARFGIKPPKFARHEFIAQRQIKAPVCRTNFRMPSADAAIQRRHDIHMMSRAGQSSGERADHVREPTRLAERMQLTGNMQNAHRGSFTVGGAAEQA